MKFKKVRKENLFSCIWASFCVCFCVLFVITISAIKTNYKNDYFSRRNYFLLSLFETHLEIQLADYVRKVQLMGGAGIEFVEGRNHHVIAFAFLSDAKAKECEKSITDYSAKLIELRAEALPRKTQKKIKNSYFCFRAFKFLSDVPQKVSKLCEEKPSNKNLYTKLQKFCTDLEAIKSQLEETLSQDDKIFESLLLAAQKYLGLAMECLKAIEEEKLVFSKLCQMLVESCICDVEMRNNIS